MTLSLPPITNGLLVLADAPADSGFPVYAVVESPTQEPDKADGTEAAYILETAGGMKYTVSDSTVLLPYLTRNMVFATDLKKGTPILLWTDGTDGSAAEKIVIFQERARTQEMKMRMDWASMAGRKKPGAGTIMNRARRRPDGCARERTGTTWTRKAAGWPLDL